MQNGLPELRAQKKKKKDKKIFEQLMAVSQRVPDIGENEIDQIKISRGNLSSCVLSTKLRQSQTGLLRHYHY